MRIHLRTKLDRNEELFFTVSPSVISIGV